MKKISNFSQRQEKRLWKNLRERTEATVHQSIDELKKACFLVIISFYMNLEKYANCSFVNGQNKEKQRNKKKVDKADGKNANF